MFCQKCRQPLRLDSSVDGLNPAAYDLLVSSFPSQPSKKPAAVRAPISQPQDQAQARKALYDTASQNAAPPTFKRNHGGGTARDSAMSFIYLTESQVGHPQPQSPQPQAQTRTQAVETTSTTTPPPPRLRRRSSSNRQGGQELDVIPGDEHGRINRLYEIISARSDIDHPICVDCTELLVDGLQKKLDEATRERDAYVRYLKKAQASQPSDDDVRAQTAALRQAERDSADAMEQLLELEQEKAALDREMLALEEESRQLDREEELFWRDRNAFAGKMADFQSERDSVNVRYNNDSQLLDKLQRSNVYNDTFCISHDGSFATINGLRLGRLSSKPVDWPEINAAWGHSLLLVVTVAEKLNYKFHGFEPQPLGSTSKIVRYDTPSPSSSRVGGQLPPTKKHVLELFSSGDMPLGLTFMHRKFDNAMVAFLELVRQLGDLVERDTAASGRPLRLPYRIDGDKIGDVSIKLGIAQDDGWTKACKLALTCCKFLLAHASNVG